jgi:DNA-binding PadR family transcriptional regulator
MAPFRLSLQTQRVLAVLLEDPSAEVYGLDIMDRAGLSSGTLYPILARLEQAGWVMSRWEDIDERAAGRRRRRYYRLSRMGAEQARLSVGETAAWSSAATRRAGARRREPGVAT